MDPFTRRLAEGYVPESPFSNHLGEYDSAMARDKKLERDPMVARQGRALSNTIDTLQRAAHFDNTSLSLLNLAILYEQAYAYWVTGS